MVAMAELREAPVRTEPQPTHAFEKNTTIYPQTGELGTATVQNEGALHAVRQVNRKTGEFSKGEHGLSLFRSTEVAHLYYDGKTWTQVEGMLFEAYLTKAKSLKKTNHPIRRREHKNWWNR